MTVHLSGNWIILIIEKARKWKFYVKLSWRSYYQNNIPLNYIHASKAYLINAYFIYYITLHSQLYSNLDIPKHTQKQNKIIYFNPEYFVKLIADKFFLITIAINFTK